MKKHMNALGKGIVALLLGSLAVSGCSNIPQAQKRTLVWSDEFNYTGLPDSTKWNYDVGGHGWGNNEQQYYTEKRRENARVENGVLAIEARKEDWQGRPYTSARLVTRGKGDWQYGRVEVRARLPKGRGSWPAIWMLASKEPLSWPDDGEIDIMEHVGWNPGFIHASVHTKSYNHVAGTQKTDTVVVADYAEQFHRYALDWTADSIKVSVDDSTYFAFANEGKGKDAWPFNQPFYLLLNVAVGGFWGAAKGIDESIWPLRMEVDYVRVYRQ
jgi:beta-glucanase (GH16 family)